MKATAPKCSCSCDADAGPAALIYPCSGCADVGEIADRTARNLDADGKLWMSCLAGISARASGLMASAAAAPALIAIDGCPIDCATKTLQLAGFTHVHSVRLTDLGFVKGRSPMTAQAVATVSRRVELLISEPPES